MKFYDQTILGKEYENEIFVGDYHFGNIHHFRLNDDGEVKANLFAEGFNLGISDIEVGPDGYLYIVADGQGAIYRIYPQSK